MEFDLGEIREGLQADVIVVGAGPAGMCAAIAAAREGVSVILVEQGGFCGGMATRGLVGPFMTCYDSKGEQMIIRGLFEEIVNRMVEKGVAIHPSQVHAGTAFTSWIVVGHEHVTPFEPEGLKLVMDEMLTEAGVKILYHTDFLRPILEGNTITGVLVSSKRGLEVLKGKVVIDCTGDGDVAARCNVPFEYGNEECKLVQPATMFFQISNVDSQAVEADIQANIDNFYRKDGVNYRSLHWRVSEAKANGDWDLKRVSIGLFRMPKPDEWCINTSRIMGVDSTDNESLTNAEMEGRRQADTILKFFRKYVPGCEDARLKATASYVGIRESRHIQGDYRLTGEDLIRARVPEDSILLAANSVDVHGRFGPTSNEYVPIQGDYYGVPYRSLLPRGVEQLLIAGRCVSADSTAAGAIRVMPPCMGMGQAAGTAAALAVKESCNVRKVNVAQLQAVLKKNGVFLEGSTPTLYMKFQKELPSAQGMSIWNDRAFILYDTGGCGVYDLKTRNPQALAYFHLGSYNPGIPTADYKNHANSCMFSKIHVDGNPIPLLYVTIGSGIGKDEDGFYYRCAVENITREVMMDGKEVYHSEVLQVISYKPEGIEEVPFEDPCWGCPSFLIDSEAGYLYIFSARYRTTRGNVPEGEKNKYIITKFRLPEVGKKGENKMQLTPKDILDQFRVESDVLFTQGGTLYDNKIYYTFGLPHRDYPIRVMVFDLQQKKVNAQFDNLDEAFGFEEIECCEVYQGKLLCNTNGGSVFALEGA